MRAYLRQGWTVYPVNPKEAEVEGLKSYASITDIPGPVERATLYLPPHLGLGVLESIKAKGVDELYVNPGAESEELLAKAEAMGLEPDLGLLDRRDRRAALVLARRGGTGARAAPTR